MGLISFLQDRYYTYKSAQADETISAWIDDVAGDVIGIVDGLIELDHTEFPDEDRCFPVIAYGASKSREGDVTCGLSFWYSGTWLVPYQVLEKLATLRGTSLDEVSPVLYGSYARELDEGEWHDYLREFGERWPGFDGNGEMIDYAACALADVLARYYSEAGWVIEHRDYSFAMRFE